jgi:hypothetical protein
MTQLWCLLQRAEMLVMTRQQSCCDDGLLLFASAVNAPSWGWRAMPNPKVNFNIDDPPGA